MMRKHFSQRTKDFKRNSIFI